MCRGKCGVESLSPARLLSTDLSKASGPDVTVSTEGDPSIGGTQGHPTSPQGTRLASVRYLTDWNRCPHLRLAFGAERDDGYEFRRG
jgi:hypothetical protein